MVPDLDTYIQMEKYRSLKPGQPWAAAESIGKRLTADYRSGALKLRRYPWRVVDGVYALGPNRDQMPPSDDSITPDLGQGIYLIDTGKGLALVDPSYDLLLPVLAAQIESLGFGVGDVHWILLTHCHFDHAQSCHLWRGARRGDSGAGWRRRLDRKGGRWYCGRIVAQIGSLFLRVPRGPTDT